MGINILIQLFHLFIHIRINHCILIYEWLSLYFWYYKSTFGLLTVERLDISYFCCYNSINYLFICKRYRLSDLLNNFFNWLLNLFNSCKQLSYNGASSSHMNSVLNNICLSNTFLFFCNGSSILFLFFCNGSSNLLLFFILWSLFGDLLFKVTFLYHSCKFISISNLFNVSLIEDVKILFRGSILLLWFILWL